MPCTLFLIILGEHDQIAFTHFIDRPLSHVRDLLHVLKRSLECEYENRPYCCFSFYYTRNQLNIRAIKKLYITKQKKEKHIFFPEPLTCVYCFKIDLVSSIQVIGKHLTPPLRRQQMKGINVQFDQLSFTTWYMG
jgi:hypothetical protein